MLGAVTVDRFEQWSEFLAQNEVRTVAEVGVYRGAFAEAMLSSCPEITTYYMVDPWKHLDDWNKPANAGDVDFEKHYAKTMERTALWESKRVVLRGRSTEVIDSIADASLDFAYIDGDHTLHGITIDLMRVWPKVRAGGFIGGDDLCRSVWQHSEHFEPTFVFPYAVYFAEAVDAPIKALPHRQFLITRTEGFSFTDTTGGYGDTTVAASLKAPASPSWARRMAHRALRA